ncbi:MAG: 4-alpha-glucanotransferase, partial [Actinobacteria bacterium]|nr:4-alpha-glucanotransferase [Actinomycetota bacterium]
QVPESHNVARDAFASLRNTDLVEYASVAAAKRSVLEDSLITLERTGGNRWEAFRTFERGAAGDYAAFRANVERRGTGWRQWPAPERAGKVPLGGPAARYHAYAQWLMTEQLSSLSGLDAGLAIDLPLGVHPEGYDTWRFPKMFAYGVSAGAPPDAFFSKGQTWGFPPVHPQRMRESGYAYFIDAMRTAFQHARALRMDHIMGIHRLYWVPDGHEAVDGTYLTYPADELYAILALESHRARALIVGEDLGTVPPMVRPAMGRHGIHRTFVLQEELHEDREPALPRPVKASFATINTHDMPTFSSFWRGSDIADRVSLGLLDETEAADEAKRRQTKREALVEQLRAEGFLAADGDDEADVLIAVLGWLAASSAAAVVPSLEDFWLETASQNTPGTRNDRPNWRRKASHDLESVFALPEVSTALQSITRHRGGAR